MKLAVYGTLRNGSDRTGHIVHTTLVYPGHQRFPALIRDANGAGAVVEVHDVDDATLEAYDRYEGVWAKMYERVRLNVSMDDGSAIEAWVYLAGEKLLAQSSSFTPIPGGDWFNR